MDFHAAFEAGQTVRVGDLVVTSGRISAAVPVLRTRDPVVVPIARAIVTSRSSEPRGTVRVLAREVPRGTYPVEVLEHSELARLVLARGTPTRWELAVREGEDERALRPGQLYGDRVDGVGFFVDAAEASRADPAAFEAIAAWSRNSEPTMCWPARDSTIVGFRADCRNRECASWWGLDDAGNVLELVTHFSGAFDCPALPDDPAFRHAWARAQVAALKSRVLALRAGGASEDATTNAFEELLRLGDDAAVALPDILSELGADEEPDVTTWLWITLARDLARYDACQSLLARWLPRAPRGVAQHIVLARGIRHMQDHFAHVFADVIATIYETRPLELSLLGLVELETGREPFEPLLERLARRSDVVGDAARAVLARWYGS